MDATFANFILRFGEAYVLTDYMTEIVLPGFTDDKLVRKYGEDTNYLFYDVQLLSVGDAQAPTIILYGRFIKDTLLTREQIFNQPYGVVPSHAEIESAPSAFFVLILNTHKLLYLPETSQPPSLSEFRSTCLNFFRIKRERYIDALYDQGYGTKKNLRKENPKPDLKVVPLSSRSSIENFVSQYSKLQELNIRVLRTNDEIDGKDMWRRIRERTGSMNSEKTELTFRSRVGLNNDEAVTEINDAAATGNSLVKLVGEGSGGIKLRGNNNEFRIKTPITNAPKDLAEKAKYLMNVFDEMVERGDIQIASPEGDERDPRFRQIANDINND